MAKRGHSDHLMAYAARLERGSAIPVVGRRVTLPDGTTATVGAINLASAEVPDRSYLAEAVGTKYENHTTTIMFSQPKIGGGLRSLVLLSMTPLATAQFIVSVEEMEKPSLQEIVDQVKIDPEPLSQFPTAEPEQTASLPASIIAVAVAGRDTCMDFYHANAFSQIKVRLSNQINLEPMVRVTIRTSLFVALVEGLKGLRGKFPADAVPWKEAHS